MSILRYAMAFTLIAVLVMLAGAGLTGAILTGQHLGFIWAPANKVGSAPAPGVAVPPAVVSTPPVDLSPVTTRLAKVEGDIASLTTTVNGMATRAYVDSVKTELDKAYADALKAVAKTADDAKAAAEKASADAKEAADEASNLRGELAARKAGGDIPMLPPRRPAETTTPASTLPSISGGDDDRVGAGNGTDDQSRRAVAWNGNRRSSRHGEACQQGFERKMVAGSLVCSKTDFVDGHPRYDEDAPCKPGTSRTKVVQEGRYTYTIRQSCKVGTL